MMARGDRDNLQGDPGDDRYIIGNGNHTISDLISSLQTDPATMRVAGE